MELILKSGAMNSDIPMYIELPWDFDESLFFYSSISPSVSLKNSSGSEFVNSATMLANRRIKVNISSDASNTDNSSYTLTISNIPTPIYESESHNNPPIIWIAESATKT